MGDALPAKSLAQIGFEAYWKTVQARGITNHGIQTWDDATEWMRANWFAAAAAIAETVREDMIQSDTQSHEDRF